MIPTTTSAEAARLLLLILICGTPQQRATKPGIKSRTLLAKLDFFLRYPAHLQRAINLLHQAHEFRPTTQDQHETTSIEAGMVRFRYGPWDHTYYTTLAYLIGKQLIKVDWKGTTEIFRLTQRGVEIARALADDSANAALVRRATTIGHVFSRYTGNRLKEFIYENFPDITNRSWGEKI